VSADSNNNNMLSRCRVPLATFASPLHGQVVQAGQALELSLNLRQRQSRKLATSPASSFCCLFIDFSVESAWCGAVGMQEDTKEGEKGGWAGDGGEEEEVVVNVPIGAMDPGEGLGRETSSRTTTSAAAAGAGDGTQGADTQSGGGGGGGGKEEEEEMGGDVRLVQLACRESQEALATDMAEVLVPDDAAFVVVKGVHL
jgi:hypothetical protein